ncbi:hypothetical protein BG015_000995 [Linnemannia schmuckeri]|uniref:Uncharacterized protein n=1 Tax=Linnemannia schmuckeri TaxID=64567 RepID=A0A9P5RQC8_9FUNG|nr:hypothetical protein BG015_000995 [Linnemannia schmuckeri]
MTKTTASDYNQQTRDNQSTIWMFPPRPQPADLISPVTALAPEPVATTISPSALKALKQRKLKERLRVVGLKGKERDRTNKKQESLMDAHTLSQAHREETPEPTAGQFIGEEVPYSMTAVDLNDLSSAITSLRSKLEIVQPEGMRPSDIAKTRAEESNSSQDNDTMDMRTDEMGDTAMEESSDALLSQVPTSQQSILLWDDLRLLVEASTSTSERKQSLVNLAVSDLGLEHLEDGVLNRLCIDEIFVQDKVNEAEQGDRIIEEIGEAEQTSSTGASQLSYQSSLFLLRVLFHRKASQLSSQPSRLFLDALLHAGKAHGRAIIDGVILPLARDYTKFSKPASELVQKVLKEQTSTSLIHFLSHVFEPLSEQEKALTSKDISAVGSIPLIFLTEAHIMAVQTALGLAALPCPLPTRLWSRFVAILGVLWEQVTGLVVACGSMTVESVPEDVAGILRLYYPTCLSERAERQSVSAGGGGGQQVRLVNKVLIQLLLTWTMRQGPHCLEIENLQRLREFCASKIDVKQGKALVSRLDMTIKKRCK